MSLGALLLLLCFTADGPKVPLWQLEPFDRLTLSNDDVHDIDPVRLPPGTKFESVPEGEYVGKPGLPPRQDIKRTVKYRIKRQEDGIEYEVFGRNIDKIEYYEDLLLAEARVLLRLDRFDECFKYLEHLARLRPDWPGLEPLRVEYLYREGSRLKLSGAWELAFWTLVDAGDRLRALPEPIDLAPPPDELIEDLTARWVTAHLEKNDYIEARRVLGRVLAARPENKTARARKEELLATARTRASEAKASLAAGQVEKARELFELSIAIAPSEEATAAELTKLYESNGHLRVGVEQLASFFGGPAEWSAADHRAAELAHEPLVTLASTTNETKWTSDIVRSIDRPDAFLNRKAIVKIRTDLFWPSDKKLVSIIDVTRLLEASCRPGSPYFHPAFARLVDKIEPTFPDTLTLDFKRPQPRPEAWLATPMTRLTASTTLAGLGPYERAAKSTTLDRYVLSPTFAGPRRPIITQVTELHFPRAADRLRALEENRIDIAADLPPRQWTNAAKIPNVRLLTRKQPTVYMIQFNFNQRLLRERTLRRALVYALDRNAILLRLGLSPTDQTLLAHAPWPTGPNEQISPPRPHDIVLAKTLVEVVKKKFATLPVLRLAHPAGEVERLACEEIARQLEIVGIKINRIEFDPAAPVSPLAADLRFLGVTMSDPLFDTMSLLTRDNPSLAEYASPTLRQLLVDLVDLPNLSAARDLLPKLRAVLEEDVAFLPLWTYADRFAVSHRVTGLNESPQKLYDAIDAWKVQPGLPPIGWQVSSSEASPAP